uniref:Neugrin n=1 Tax=Bos taurus TaxID=9913 RepID=A0AAF6Z046_BOVIN
MVSAIGSLPQRPETTEKSHPVPENSKANGGVRCPTQDPDVGSHGADPLHYWGMQDLTSLTRVHTCLHCVFKLPALEARSLHHCTVRYLHREFSESWSVPRLAEGFDVSTDVIRRVLKSKFIPTLEQKLKQDQKVLKKIGLARSIPELPGPGDSSKPLSAGQSVSGSLLIPGDEASSRGHGHSTALKAIELNTQSTNITTRQTERNKGVQGLEEGKDFVPVAAGHPTSTCRGARGIDSDGLPSDKRLEELKAGEAGDQIFSKRVVQRGREFFDSNGNFLYRI